MKPGVLKYKCRNCERFETSLHSPDALISLIDAMHGTSMIPGHVVAMTGIHICGPGMIGVTDLVGAVYDDGKEES